MNGLEHDACIVLYDRRTFIILGTFHLIIDLIKRESKSTIECSNESFDKNVLA